MVQPETLGPSTLPDEQRQGLLELVARIDAALAQRDAKAFAAEFAADATCTNPLGEHARGRANIETLMRGDLDRIAADASSKIELTGVRLLSPTLAMADLEHRINRAVYPDGTVRPIEVHVSSVARRSGSRWEVLDARAYVLMTQPMVH